MYNINLDVRSMNINNKESIMYKFNKQYNNYKKTQSALNKSSNITVIEKKDNKKNQDELMKQKITNMKMQLAISQDSEQNIQNGMSILQEKETSLSAIQEVGNELRELSEQYKNPNLNDKDKGDIEKQAEKLLNGLANLMNKSKEQNNAIADSVIPIKDSDGKYDIILSSSFNITLDTGSVDNDQLKEKDEKNMFNNKHFESKISVKTLLKKTSIIEERILKPVQKAIKDVNDKKNHVYTKFMDEYSESIISINKLFNLGGISEYEKDAKLQMQQSIYDNAYALEFQSLNINRDNVFKLLR